MRMTLNDIEEVSHAVEMTLKDSEQTAIFDSMVRRVIEGPSHRARGFRILFLPS
jgi:hypothetical protein